MGNPGIDVSISRFPLNKADTAAMNDRSACKRTSSAKLDSSSFVVQALFPINKKECTCAEIEALAILKICHSMYQDDNRRNSFSQQSGRRLRTASASIEFQVQIHRQ